MNDLHWGDKNFRAANEERAEGNMKTAVYEDRARRSIVQLSESFPEAWSVRPPWEW